MSYINTAQIALHKKEIEKLNECVAELKVLMEEMGSHFKQQPKVDKAASTEAKDRVSGSNSVVAKGTHQGEQQAPLNTSFDAPQEVL